MIVESLRSLNPLESFDVNVFVEDKTYSQGLCNFILALSLIWNDTKNLLLYFDFLKNLEKQETNSCYEKTPFWGEIYGIKNYIEKMIVALIHELFKLIRESKNEIYSHEFKEILRLLHKECRIAWDTIEKYAFGGADPSTPLGKAFLMVRHKIANHYDKDELFKGYERKFIKNKYQPYISRGDSMLVKRFYFADAAAQEYYRQFIERITINDYYKNLNLIKDSISLAIQNIVETFIQKRSPWKNVDKS